MNFLAHLVLASPAGGGVASAHALVGNLMPDLTRDLPGFRDVRGVGGSGRGRRAERLAALPAAVRAGVDRHRQIDRATDVHPAFFATRARLSPTFGRFSGVVADVLFDHALSLRWDAGLLPLGEDDAAPVVREAFIAGCYAALKSAEARDVMPGPMQHAIDAMVRHDWLNRYATVAGIDQTLFELSVRFTRRYDQSVSLVGVVEHLHEHTAALLADFDALWLDLVARLDATK